jgi:hypothetical protein
MGAETHDVDSSHGGRKIAGKPGESKRGLGFALGPSVFHGLAVVKGGEISRWKQGEPIILWIQSKKER